MNVQQQKKKEKKFNPIESTQVSIVKPRIDPKGKMAPLRLCFLINSSVMASSIQSYSYFFFIQSRYVLCYTINP